MDNYIGEIRPVGFKYAPSGWVLCDGSLLSIAAYSALFTLLGTTYGGDGQTTFGVPDLRGRAPLHAGSAGGANYVVGQPLGTETVTLQANQVGGHTHPLNTGPTGNASVPSGSTMLADVGGTTIPIVYGPVTELSSMMSQTIGANAGGGQPHENRQPYLVVNYIIATEGVFPPQV